MDAPEAEQLTTRAVAALLGVDETTVYGYVRRGLASTSRPAGMRRRLTFRLADVRAFAEEHNITIASEAHPGRNG